MLSWTSSIFVFFIFVCTPKNGRKMHIFLKCHPQRAKPQKNKHIYFCGLKAKDVCQIWHSQIENNKHFLSKKMWNKLIFLIFLLTSKSKDNIVINCNFKNIITPNLISITDRVFKFLLDEAGPQVAVERHAQEHGHDDPGEQEKPPSVPQATRQY